MLHHQQHNYRSGDNNNYAHQKPQLTRNAYYFMIDNFTLLNEYDIDRYNDNVFGVFKKYNADKFNWGFVDCSVVVLLQYFDLDFIVSFDKNFELFEEITLCEF